MEVYVDDMLVKSQATQGHVEDLVEMFEVFRRHGMKLNPSKCTFKVSKGKFLSFMVTQKRIETNPKMIKVFLDIESPKFKRDIKVLTGRIATLNHFVSKFIERCLPFFKI